jgi:hypothetical protein
MNNSISTAKRYITSIIKLVILYSIICIPGLLLGLFSSNTIITAAIAAFIGHLIGFFPLSLPRRQRPKPSSVVDTGDTTTIYVGNILYRTKREELVDLFSPYGNVVNARIITDKDTRKPKGFGFVEMPVAQAPAAIDALNNFEFNGRALKVNEAKGR